MLEKFESFVKKKRLFNRKSKLLLALSGGEDSVCLFHLLKDCGFKFDIAHCNFNLRGDESDGDEKFVRKLAEKFGITGHFKSFDTRSEAKNLGLNTQETARFLRYKWFDELSADNAFDRILTAHHKDDNTETMLINLLRGTGIAGLHGIPVINGKICRPLLCFRKEEISEFVDSEGIKFRSDSSNLKDDYLRNRIRHKVLPQLLSIDRRASESFFSTSEKVSEFEDLSHFLIKERWSSITEIKNGEQVLLFDSLKKFDAELLKTFLFECLRPMGFSRTQTDKLAEIKLPVGSKFESETYRIITERKCYIIQKRQIITRESAIIKGINDQVTIGTENYVLEKIKRNLVDFSQQNCLYFEASDSEFPLRVRSWQKGDKIRPMGMKGKKKISDILTDKKVPNSQRSNQLVIENNKGELIALLPNTISEVHKVRHDSIDVLRFRQL